MDVGCSTPPSWLVGMGREAALEPGIVLHLVVRLGIGASLHLEGNSMRILSFS